MGISDGDEGGGLVDASVGTIVWVRRRNGSWWPGRILGPEELSASHLMSPRSGTPVKLLGRDDASVDWYNLEKSKRVKPFRCGEFDACIERAEASQGIPIKKREKYARREDAILHALELEKQQLEVNHPKLGTISNGTMNRNPGSHRRDLHSFSSDIYMADDEPRVHSKYANHKSHMLLRKTVLLGEEENKGDTLYVRKGKTSEGSGYEEYNNESFPRMRGLQDFGLRIAPPKKKFSQSFIWEASHKPVDTHLDAPSNVSHTGSGKSSLTIKRKRSLGGNGEDSSVKKRDRRRPLVQVLQSSAKLPVLPSFQSEYDSGGILMQGESDYMGAICRSKRSNCVYFPAGSNDSLDNDGYHSEEMLGISAQLETGNGLDYDGSLAEEYSTSGLAEETESDSAETDYLEPDLEEDQNFTDTTQTLIPGSKVCEPLLTHSSENFRDMNEDEMPFPDYVSPLHLQDQMIDSKWHMKGKRNIRNLSKRPNGSIEGNTYKIRTPGFYHNSFNEYDDTSHLFSSHMSNDNDDYDEMEPMLIDVNIEVQKRSYQGEHVPWVSLSSKWNGGKPILGHPVQIEILEDGSTDNLVPKFDAPPSFSRTGKRTVINRNSQKKNQKRVSLSNQKTRTLSSFSNERKFSRRGDLLNGLIKPEGGIPLVTCVPMKVVFSRILEAVGRPSSGSAHRARGLS